jgi:hypothetical protein
LGKGITENLDIGRGAMTIIGLFGRIFKKRLIG